MRYAMESYQRASGTASAFAGLSADLVAEGHPQITVNSGDREPDVQETIFRSKFVPSAGPKDVGPYNDRKFWPGHGYWKRVVGGGTVGVPLTSNHEKRRAADLAYPYNSDTAAHRRAKQLAPRHNITCEGENFDEKWHWTYWGPLGTINIPGGGSASGGSSSSKGFLMALDDDKQQQIYDGVSALYAAIFGVNGTLGSLPQSTNLPTQIETIRQAVASLQTGQANTNAYLFAGGPGVDGTIGAPGSVFGRLVNAAGGSTVDVNEAELAAQLAPLLSANLTALSDADVQRLAKAAADESDRRQRERLGVKS